MKGREGGIKETLGMGGKGGGEEGRLRERGEGEERERKEDVVKEGKRDEERGG